RRKMLALVPVGEDVLSFQEGIGMENDRYPRPAVALDQSDETARVVGVPVTEHDGVHLIGFDFQYVQIVQYAINGNAVIEKERVVVVFWMSCHGHGHAVLGPELRLRQAIACARRPPRNGGVTHEYVD